VLRDGAVCIYQATSRCSTTSRSSTRSSPPRAGSRRRWPAGSRGIGGRKTRGVARSAAGAGLVVRAFNVLVLECRVGDGRTFVDAFEAARA
jgi:hypothetical protein